MADPACISTSSFVNTILRIRNFIIKSVVTSTSKTISTNFSKYGHRNLRTGSQSEDCFDAPSHIPYAFVVRVYNKIHIINIAC